jgi:aromatic-L-amino-acid decarboxylase
MKEGHDTYQSVPALFPPSEERRHYDDFLTRALARSHDRVAEGPVIPDFDPIAFRNQLAGFDFETPRPLDEILSWTIAHMEHGLVHVTHPRYFGLYNPAPAFPAQCADRIAGMFNPQLATSTTSPAAVEIESHVISAVAGRAGFSNDAAGHFTSGGSEANYTAVVCALTRSNARFESEGARAFDGPPALYVSKESHLAWIKIAHQAGIGRSAVRLVETDGSGRMDPSALEGSIRADCARGCIPIMIAATAGTTNAGMIDPLQVCAQIARRRGLWYHVDAAWGGALIASDRLRGMLSGIEQADSATIDAHKWFATTMGCGMFITAHPSVLTSAFHVSTSFMPSNFANRDPYVTSVQWSRRFMGLRLFVSLAAAGWAGYGQHVERSVRLSDLIKTMLVERGWSIANNSPLAVLCVQPPSGSGPVRKIAARVLASGRAWVAPAIFEGNDIIRICVTHGESVVTDVMELVNALEIAARESESTKKGLRGNAR